MPPALNPTTGSPFPPLGLSAAMASSGTRKTTDTPPAVNRWATALPSSIGVTAFASKDNHAHPHNHAHESVTSSIAHHGLPPPPAKIDLSQALRIRLQDAIWSDEEDEEMECPLCLEEIDITDSNFKPCPCGYRICRFCWHNIIQNFNGRCPACRRMYSEEQVEFTPMSTDEIKYQSQVKKQREREKKELEQMNRTRLAQSRIVQRNLVYVTGLASKLATEDLIPTLKSHDYFGQYGRIAHVKISRRQSKSKLVMGTQDTSIGVYVTYTRREDAARAIVSIEGTKSADGTAIHASYGTNKYCTTYLRNLPCQDPDCNLLHEPADEIDTFTKEDLHHLRPSASDTDTVRAPAAAPSSKQELLTSWGAPIDRPPIAPPSHLPAPPTHAAIVQAAQQSHSAHSNNHTLPHAPSHAQTHLHDSDNGGGTALPKTASWGSSGGLPVRPVTNGVTTPGGLRQEDLPPLSAALAHSQAAQAMAQQPKKQRVTKKDSKDTPKIAAASPCVRKEEVADTSVASASGWTKPTIADVVKEKNSPKPAAVTAAPPGLASAAKEVAVPLEADVQPVPLTKDEARTARMPLDIDVSQTVDSLVDTFGLEGTEEYELNFSLDEQRGRDALASKEDRTNIATASSWHAISLAALGIGTITGFGSLAALRDVLHAGANALDSAASSLVVDPHEGYTYRGRFDPFGTTKFEEERRASLKEDERRPEDSTVSPLQGGVPAHYLQQMHRYSNPQAAQVAQQQWEAQRMQSPSVATSQPQGSNALLAQIMAAASNKPGYYQAPQQEPPFYDPAVMGLGRQPSRVGLQGLSQGLGQGLAQGLNQGLGQGLNQGLNQGLTQGLGQTLGAGLGQGLSPAQAAQAQAMLYRNAAPSTSGMGVPDPFGQTNSEMSVPPGFAPRMGRMPIGLS